MLVALNNYIRMTEGTESEDFFDNLDFDFEHLDEDEDSEDDDFFDDLCEDENFFGKLDEFAQEEEKEVHVNSKLSEGIPFITKFDKVATNVKILNTYPDLF